MMKKQLSSVKAKLSSVKAIYDQSCQMPIFQDTSFQQIKVGTFCFQFNTSIKGYLRYKTVLCSKQACDFSGFYWNSVILNIFLSENSFKNPHIKKEKTGGEGVGRVELIIYIHFIKQRHSRHQRRSNVKTIYSVSIEQKKQNYLQKLPGVLVSKKDEVICSANKQLCKFKLVNVYVMLFIENEKEKKRNKRKKNLPFLPLFIKLLLYLKQRSILPLSAIICRPGFPCLSRRTSLHLYSIAWVFLSR